jgi:hypothetical protein
MPGESMTVIGNRYENIYIMTPTVRQDGKEIKKYNYEPLVMSVMTLHRSFARNYDIDGIYNNSNIETMGRCDYIKKPFKCSNENDHWALMTDIQITRSQAYISMTLFDENSMPIAAAIVSKKIRRKIIPHKKRTVTSVPAGIGVSGRTKTSCKSKEDCTQETTGVIAGRTATTATVEDLPPTIINFPAIINNEDVRQAAMLLYSSIR